MNMTVNMIWNETEPLLEELVMMGMDFREIFSGFPIAMLILTSRLRAIFEMLLLWLQYWGFKTPFGFV